MLEVNDKSVTLSNFNDFITVDVSITGKRVYLDTPHDYMEFTPGEFIKFLEAALKII